MYKYGTIVKVYLLGANSSKPIGHLLLTSNNDFQVDLNGDFIFNELPVFSVINATRVDSLEDVFEYFRLNDIEIPFGATTEEGLLVGGERDFLIDKELVGNWCEDLALV